MMVVGILNTVLAEYPTPERVKIQNKLAVSELIDKIAHAGSESLQVITDFDATLTTATPGNGGPFSRSPLMPADYKERSKLRAQQYLHIEMNPELTVAEKSEQILSVFSQGQADIMSTGLTRATFLKVMEGSRIPLREGTDKMMECLHSVGIPVLVFSAGIGNMIEETLRLNEIRYPNIEIVSNFMIFESGDDGQKITRWSTPKIHIFNKNESVIPKNSPFFQTFGGSHRPNVILLGDSLGDVTMADGVRDVESVLKIGFLNNHVEDRLDSFLAAFDIVLIQDQTMNFVNLLLEALRF